MEKISGIDDKMRQMIKEAAGDNELPDEALEQIAGGLATDLAARLEKAGYAASPREPISSSEG